MLVSGFLFWLGLAIVVGIAADTRRRNGIGWFFLAIVISPLLAGLLLLALPRRSTMAGAPVKKCPYCAQMIPLEALVCHLCGREVDTPESVKVLLENEKEREENNQKSLRKARREVIIVIMIIIIIISYIIFLFKPAARNGRAETIGRQVTMNTADYVACRETYAPT
jgi:hypothetical protein